MRVEDRAGLLKLAFVAACVDPPSDTQDQAQLRRVAEMLTPFAEENLAVTLRDILLQRLPLEEVTPGLARPELNLPAYEIAVCICNADSAHTDREHAFLEQLRMALALDVRTARSFERQADAIIGVPLQPDPARMPPSTRHPVDRTALDRIILDHAVLNAAFATRAQPLALLATVPLQMKMVYRIGKAYGHEPDRDQIKHVMSVLGIEPVSQYVEACGRLILAGVFDRPSSVRETQHIQEASANQFAVTSALGEIAKRLYGEGKPHADESHHDAYRQAYAATRITFLRYAALVESKARQTEVNELLDMVKSQ